MCVELRVARRKFRALVDSGACRSLMSGDTFEDIRESLGNSLQLHRIPPGMVLKSLSKDTINCKGLVKISIYGTELEFFVVSNIIRDLLLVMMI